MSEQLRDAGAAAASLCALGAVELKQRSEKKCELNLCSKK